MASLILRWVTRQDDRVCPICQELNGYEWRVEVESGSTVPDQLYHPVHDLVWASNGPRSHSHTVYGSCRCRLELDADIQDLVEMGRAKLVALKEGKAQGDAVEIE